MLDCSPANFSTQNATHTHTHTHTHTPNVMLPHHHKKPSKF